MTTETPTPPSSEPSIASVAAEPLPAAEAPAPARTLGESLYPAEAQPAPEAQPAVVDASTDQPTDPATPASGEEPVEGEPKPADASPEEATPPPVLTADSYADLTLGDDFTPNEEALTAAKSIFAEAQLPVESAQKLLDLYATNIKATAEAAAKATQETFTALNTKWAAETNALPEMQGEAKKQTLAILGRTMDEFGSPEAREAFNLTGAGNNPHIVRYILSLAQAVVEGGPTPAGAPVATDPRKGKSLGQRLYPNSPN